MKETIIGLLVSIITICAGFALYYVFRCDNICMEYKIEQEKSTMVGMFGEMKLRAVSLFKMAHNGSVLYAVMYRHG